MWQELDNLGTPIPKTLLTPEVKRLVVVACKTQTRFPARIERDRLSKAVDALGKAIKTMPDPCEDPGGDDPT